MIKPVKTVLAFWHLKDWKVQVSVEGYFVIAWENKSAKIKPGMQGY